MNLPFTAGQFFSVFAIYNRSVWPMQIVLTLLAIAAVGLLFGAPLPQPGDRWHPRVLLGLDGRRISLRVFQCHQSGSLGFGVFTLVGGVWFAWTGVLGSRLRFARFAVVAGLRAWLGGLLVAFALLVYPLPGVLFGHRYPAAPTFGLPCPTTIFTIGMLLFAAPPVPRSVFVVPLLWSVGSSAAFQLGVRQDYGLLAAGLIGLADVIFPQPGASHGNAAPLG